MRFKNTKFDGFNPNCLKCVDMVFLLSDTMTLTMMNFRHLSLTMVITYTSSNTMEFTVHLAFRLPVQPNPQNEKKKPVTTITVKIVH
jgi:hypothetical protein